MTPRLHIQLVIFSTAVPILLAKNFENLPGSFLAFPEASRGFLAFPEASREKKLAKSFFCRFIGVNSIDHFKELDKFDVGRRCCSHGFCIESEKKKEMGELVKNRSNSEGIQKDHAGMDVVRAAEAMYNRQNSGRSDGSLRNYFCEKEGFTSQQRLGLQAFEEKFNEEKGLPSWIGSGNGGATHAVAEFIPRLDLSAVGSCSNSINLFPTQSGFGSPIAVAGGFERRTSSGDDQDDRSGFVTSTYRPSLSTITGKQSTAQLTIFYGATVNVYDDIPGDKAQSIMLIASSGNCSKYPHTKVQNGCGSLTELKTSLPLLQLLNGSGINHQPVSSTVHTDLPIKRKQSLQRFLQKRKDRVIANAKPPYKAAEADNSKPRQDPLPSSPLARHSNSLS